MKKLLILTLFSVFLLASCSSSKKSTDVSTLENQETNDALVNTVWELTTLGGIQVDPSSLDDKKIHFTLNATNNTITGFSGCNSFNGTYTLEAGNRLSFSKLASTRMACMDAEVNESDLFKVFGMADNYTINNGQLMLNVGRRAPLAIFKKREYVNPITEKYWKLTKLNGQNITMSPNQEREIYFMLKRNENRVKGFASCNMLMGSYSLEEGNRIRFNNMTTTLKLCPDVPFKESDFLKVFEIADNYTINGDQLSLNVGRRAPLAIFEAIYF